MPPHQGHLFVCDVARRYVDDLTVFVCSHDAEPIDGFLRADWMRQSLEPLGCKVVHMHRDIPQAPGDDPNFWDIWRNVIFEHHPAKIDFVFGSEDYIIKLANVVDAAPFIVDRDRQMVPVSATAIREDPARNWDFIPQAVRPFYQKRVTLIGPESTGKSTLSNQLATQFQGGAIPEYGREYDAQFKQGSTWDDQDFIAIAKGHLAIAQTQADRSGQVVIEDTDLLQTVVWSEALLSLAPSDLVTSLERHKPPDLYLLLSPEIPWVNDGTRYHSTYDERIWFYNRLEYWLTKFDMKWRVVSGSNWDTRAESALNAITEVCKVDRSGTSPITPTSTSRRNRNPSGDHSA